MSHVTITIDNLSSYLFVVNVRIAGFWGVSG
jgi:hypothetical protein